MRWSIIIIWFFVANIAAAESISIALPELVGDYDTGAVLPNDAPSSAITSFTLSTDISTISYMRMVISGTSEGGQTIFSYDVGGFTVYDTLPVFGTMRLFLTAPTLEGGCFTGAIAMTNSEFSGTSELVQDCDYLNPLDYNLLLNTTVQAELQFLLPDQGTPWIDAQATLSDFQMVFEVDLVPTEETTWDEIKVLYR